MNYYKLQGMKKIMGFLILFLPVITAFSQNNNENMLPRIKLTHESPENLYLQKSKNQKTTGLILLAGGTAMVIGGLIAFDKNWDRSGSYAATDISGFIAVGGIVADLVSIPFLISAHKNKKKAKSLMISFHEINSRYGKSNKTGPHTVLTLRAKF